MAQDYHNDTHLESPALQPPLDKRRELVLPVTAHPPERVPKPLPCSLHPYAQGRLLESVPCRNTRCSTPNYKRSRRLRSAAMFAYRVYPCAFSVAAAASPSGFCGLGCMLNREDRLQLPWCTALFGHRRPLHLLFPLERLIRRLFCSHLRACMPE
jgi:hypothetical protein